MREDDYELRFDAGRFEDPIVSIIFLVQFTLVAIAALVAGSFLLMSGGLSGTIPLFSIVTALGLTVYLLDFLYQ